MNSFFEWLLAIIASVTMLLSILFFVQLRWPAPALWFLKLYVSALSPCLVFLGLLASITGLASGSYFILLTGIYIVSIYSIHIFRVTREPSPPGNFEQVYGRNWEDQVSQDKRKYFLPSRLSFRLPKVPAPIFHQNIPFATLPFSGRKLLCDIWLPPQGISPSGLGLIYLHGSAFYLLDKDFGTRKFFRHLAAQGHTIMDVAYRLAPETGISGMVNDVNRAITWMKDHAWKYGIDAEKIVLCGGSAGGHLALLTAYTSQNPFFKPTELKERDCEVCAVISLYGTNDLESVYYHTNQHLTTRAIAGRRKKPVPTKMPAWMVKKMGSEFFRLGLDKGFANAGALAPLIGGHPDECPELYKKYSPIHHVHSNCPSTLLIHGEDDIMAPVMSTRNLYARLLQKRVPAILNILPQTEHAFDLVLPEISPAAHNLYYDVERFLAMQEKEKDEQFKPLQKNKQLHSHN